MSTANQEQLRAIVFGHVQGVNFRYHTVQMALRLGLTGWVQNRRDGTVEVRAEGLHGQLEEFCQFLRQGPPSARVRQVDVQWLPASGAFSSFIVRYSGED